MRISDYRLSPAMEDLLVGIVTGAVRRNSGNFPAATAEALHKRGLVDSEFHPCDIGREVAGELLARMPMQFAEPYLARLISGLNIFQLYEPHARPHSTQRSCRCLVIQNKAFDEISVEHRKALNEIGWEQTGRFEWVF